MSTSNPKLRERRDPVIISREPVLTTPFFRLIAKKMAGQVEGTPYYSLELADYAAVVAVTSGGSVVLVRQFRPAVEMVTLELPAGHVEEGQRPDEAARIELLEETGHVVTEVQLLGRLTTDTGRLANRMWVYFAQAAAPAPSWEPEPGVDVVVASPSELAQWVREGTFNQGLQLGAIFLAVQAGCITL